MANLKNMTTKSPKQKPVPVKIVSDTATTKYVEDDKKWKAQSDLRTLQSAEEIRQDKERMKAAKDCAKEQMKQLSKIK